MLKRSTLRKLLAIVLLGSLTVAYIFISANFKSIFAAVDDQYSVALLHFEGANNSTTFTDESGKIWTNYADAKISTDQYKFGASSGYFDGNAYLETPNSTDFNFGNGNWTIDFWLKTANSGTQRVIKRSVTSSFPAGDWNIGTSGGSVTFGLADYSDSVNMITTSTTVNDNIWHHIALVRNGDTYTIYIDGIASGNNTKSGAITDLNGDILVGAWLGYSQGFNGYIDELRVTKGVARWMANFPTAAREYTAPTITIAPTATPITPATGGTVTNSGAYTIHTFTSSGTFTVNSDLTVDVLVVAGGGAGGKNPGAGGGGGGGLLYQTGRTLSSGSKPVVIGDGGVFSGGHGQNGGNTTFDGMTALGGGGGPGNAGGSGGGGGDGGVGGAATQGDSNGATGFGYAGGDSTGYNGFGGGGAGAIGTSGGGNGRQFDISGVSQYYAGGGGGCLNGGGSTPGGLGGGGTSCSGTGTANTGGGGSGGWSSGNAGGSGIVIIRYLTPGYVAPTATNTPVPTNTPTPIPTVIPGVDDSYTKALLHMNGANNSTTFTDESGKTWTAGDNAKVSTGQYVFGGASAYFDGTNDYVSATDSSDWSLGSSNFTIDLWEYFTTNSIGYQPLACNCGTGDAQGWVITLETNNRLYFYSSSNNGGWNAANMSSSFQPAINTWYHIAVVRNGNAFNMYVNGTSVGSTNYSGSIAKGSNGIILGRYPYYPGGARTLNGYIDEFRFSNGIARWTGAFTPSAKEYTPHVIIPGTVQWDGGANTSNWSDAANWDTDQVPGVDDNVIIASTTTVNIAGSTTIKSLTLGENGITVPGTLNFTYDAIANGALIINGGDLNAYNGATITHSAGSGSNIVGRVNIDVQAGNINIASGASINANSKGYPGTQGPYAGVYAGYYGSLAAPVDYGGGGPSGDCTGGGAIKINTSGTLTNNGIITSVGGNSGGNNSASAGGSIYITAGTVTGSGSITANGGVPSNPAAAAGGGGRIAIYYSNSYTFNGTLQAVTGSPGAANAPGTFFVENSVNHDLLIPGLNNTWKASERNWSFRNVTINGSVGFKSENAQLLTISISGQLSFGGSTMTVSLLGSNTNGTNGTGVYLNLNGDITIPSNVTLSANSGGYPGATGPGQLGLGVYGGYYGSLTEPMDLGTGGNYDGYGGGAIKITTGGTLTVNGNITATGGGASGNNHAASGGSIYITADSLAGSGSIKANGGIPNNPAACAGGGGRVAVYYNSSNTFNGTVQAISGTPGACQIPGTSFVESTTTHDLIIPAYNNTWSASDRASFTFRNLTINGGITFKPLNATLLTITSTGTTTFANDTYTINSLGSYTNGTNGVGVSYIFTGDVTIPSTVTFNANGNGYAAGVGPCAGTPARYGGCYGSYVAPVDLGSGSDGSGGGGAIKISATGTLTLNGSITANGSGSPGNSSAGSGGSAYLTAGAIAGSGSILVNGGTPNNPAACTGGGGRIAIIYGTTNTFNGTISAAAGNCGAAGTIYTASSLWTPIPTPNPGPDDQYTKALLHMNGADASTIFTDESGKTWTTYGGTKLTVEQYKFGGASGIFNGSNSYLSTPNNNDFNLGSGDFTIDYWMKSTQTSQYATHFSKMPGAWGPGMWTIICNYAAAGDINFYAYDYSGYSGGVLRTAGGLINTGQWTHIAIVRYGNVWTLYVNGVAKATNTASFTINDLAGGVSIGRDDAYARYYNGLFDEFRFTKGLARWTSDFTPPASQYESAPVPTSTPTAIPTATPTPQPAADTYGNYQANLSSAYNADVFSLDSNRSDGNMDGSGNTYPGDGLPDHITMTTIKFNLGSAADGVNNAVSALGQNVSLPYQTAQALNILAAGVGYQANQTFTINYAGYSEQVSASISNWIGSAAYGEDIATAFDHRHTPSGNDAVNLPKIYAYKILLGNAELRSITLPNNSAIKIFAMTVETTLPAPTDTPMPTNTTIPTSTPTNTLVPTATNTPTAIPTNTLIPTNTPTLTPTDTPTLIPTYTPTVVPTNTPVPNTSTPTPTITLTPTITNSPIPTSTSTPLPTSTPTSTPQPVADEDGNYQANLNGSYNTDVFSLDSNRADGNMDGNGSTYPGDGLPNHITLGTIKFNIGPATNGAYNAISALGQNIELPYQTADMLHILAASVGNYQNLVFSINYIGYSEEVAVSVSNWTSNAQFGENIGLAFNHVHISSGNDFGNTPNIFEYGILLGSDQLQSITLPGNSSVKIFAITLETQLPLPTLTATPLPTNAPSLTPSNTPLPTETPMPTATETLVPTYTPLPTNTPTTIPTNTLIPTHTPTVEPTNTTVPTNTPTLTPTDTLVPTNTSTPVPTDTLIPSGTPVASNTPTLFPSNTPIPADTSTPVPTNTPSPTPQSSADEQGNYQANLNSVYNSDVFSLNSDRTDGNMDGNGSTYPGDDLPGYVIISGVKFNLGSAVNGENNAISGSGQTLSLPYQTAEALHVLASAVGNQQNQVFSINYEGYSEEISLSISNWTSLPQYSEINALEFNHKHIPSGDSYSSLPGIYEYKVLLGTKKIQSITLPNNSNVKIFGVTLETHIPLPTNTPIPLPTNTPTPEPTITTNPLITETVIPTFTVRPTSGVTIVPSPTGTSSDNIIMILHLVGPNGKDLANMAIELAGSQYTTDDRGQFIVQNLPKGTYELKVFIDNKTYTQSLILGTANTKSQLTVEFADSTVSPAVIAIAVIGSLLVGGGLAYAFITKKIEFTIIRNPK